MASLRAGRARARRPSAGAGEYFVALAGLLVLHRAATIFFRLRSAPIVGGPVSADWLEDPLIRLAFWAVGVGAVACGLRRCGWRSAGAQPLLLAFVVLATASTVWSVEPAVTLSRATLLAVAVALGAYVGQRFSFREQAALVSVTGGLLAALCVVALVAWPDLARSTADIPGAWSGVFINRNSLAAAMGTGLLGLAFFLPYLPGPARVIGAGVGALELYLLVRSGNRTLFVALAATAGLTLLAVALRALRHRGASQGQEAAAAGLVLAAGGWLLQRNWATVVNALGRDPTLDGRTVIWGIDSTFFHRRPVVGWGFEAIWAHRPTFDESAWIYGRPFASAHSGYWEILLGLGLVGMALFGAFAAVTAWRAFQCASEGRDLESLWPLALVVFVGVLNTSESFFAPGEVLMALFVTAGFGATARIGTRTLSSRQVGSSP